MTENKSAVVSGVLVFPATGTPWLCATVAYLEDVTETDQSSKTIGHVSLGIVSSDGREELEQPFTISAIEPIDPKGSYNIRAHGSLSQSHDVCRGDFVTTQAYPVLTFGYPNKVRVNLQVVE